MARAVLLRLGVRKSRTKEADRIGAIDVLVFGLWAALVIAALTSQYGFVMCPTHGGRPGLQRGGPLSTTPGVVFAPPFLPLEPSQGAHRHLVDQGA